MVSVIVPALVISQLKRPIFQPLGEQAEALPVPVQNFDEVTSAAAEGKQVARERILLEQLLRQHGEAVEAAAHVGGATGE